MQSIFDLSIGLRYTTYFCNDCYRFEIGLSWEQHLWIDHTQRFQLQRGVGGLSRDSDFTELEFVSTDLEIVESDLAFGGPSLHIRFDF